jgi:hypothetical protein
VSHATRNTKSQGVSLAPNDRAKLRALIQREGETAALGRLRIARQTLARCVAGLPVQRATAECVSRRLNEAQGDAPPPAAA